MADQIQRERIGNVLLLHYFICENSHLQSLVVLITKLKILLNFVVFSSFLIVFFR